MKRKRAASKMEDFSNVVISSSEFIPGRLFFVTINTNSLSPKSTSSTHYFAVNTEQLYDSFYNDFGPLNLAKLYHYCGILERKLSSACLASKKVVHYTQNIDKDRVNAAFLIGAYAVIYLNYEPEQAYEVLVKGSKKDFIEFRDASVGDPYTLKLLDCLKAVKKALDCGFFDFSNFNYFEYERFERVNNGDLNWIVPEKFIAFCGPQNKPTIEDGYRIHSPETYFWYFRKHNVTTIVRLNKKAYDSNRFVQAGFDHKDLFFIDGGIPNDRIVNKFLSVCENTKGAIAVHCKAGLGRTGTLIACYIMKHYKFTAQEAIAWIRICRPGSIIAHQQTWLLQKQSQLWASGDEHRLKHKITVPIRHTVGIYGHPPANNNNKTKPSDNVTGIMKKVDLMELNDKNEEFDSEENKITQGDRLNEIKAQRLKAKQSPVSNLTDRKAFRSKVIVSATTTSSVRVGRIISNAAKCTTSSRVLTKRNEQLGAESVQRRCSQRKTVAAARAAASIAAGAATPKKKENRLAWMMKNGEPPAPEVKRCKRALQAEKDRASPNVKVLRRSQGVAKKRLHLPSVKLNKSI